MFQDQIVGIPFPIIIKIKLSIEYSVYLTIGLYSFCYPVFEFGGNYGEHTGLSRETETAILPIACTQQSSSGMFPPIFPLYLLRLLVKLSIIFLRRARLNYDIRRKLVVGLNIYVHAIE